MKYLTLGVFITLSVMLTYKESPKGVLNTVRQDFRERGIDPRLWDSSVIVFYDNPSFYGISLSMGAYAKSIHIGVNGVSWRSMSMRQKKALIAHEITHCIGIDPRHCYNTKCVMSGGNISKWGKVPYEEMLDELIKHHYERKVSSSFNPTIGRDSRTIHLDEVVIFN